MPNTQLGEPEDGNVVDLAIAEDEVTTNEVRYEISSYGADYPVDSLA